MRVSFGLRIVLITLAIAGATGCAHAPAEPSPKDLASRAADQALAMVGKPYRYGGNTPAGFDCSGLVQYSYARVGIALPHGTASLHRLSQPVSRNRLQRGDLLFFTQEGKRSSHVGLYLGDNRFVHAPSNGKQVYVTRIDDPYWRRHLTEARRLDIY
jgi:murein DD-endopeptidase